MLQLKHLEKTLVILREKETDFTRTFYERLFGRRPGFKALFEHLSMAEQTSALMAALIIVVESQRQPNQLENYLHALGERHDGLGLGRGDFDIWIQTMLETMAEYCGSRWDEDAELAWLATLRYAVEIMQQAVEAPSGQSPG